MKPSNELYKLIKSLSKSEKRFFKLNSSLQAGEKNYLKIFDFIDRQDDYNEEDLKNHFRNEKFVKHLPSEKNHLYRLILKSLRSFYSEQSVSSVLKQELKNIEILYNKALYKECEKFVYRAKDIAKDYERFYYSFELISWEKKLLEEAYESGEFGFELDALVQEEGEVIEKLRNLAEYQIIYSKINLIFRSGGFSRNAQERMQVDEIANHPLIKGKNTAISTRAASICYYIKGLCAATNRNFEEAYTFFNKSRLIMDNNPKIKEDNGARYLLILTYLCRCHIENKQFDEASDLIQAIKNLSTEKGFNSTDVEVKIYNYTFQLEVRLLQAKGEFALAVELFDLNDKKQNEFGDKINKEQQVLFAYYRAYSCFGIREYKRALVYLNEVLNDNETNLRQDIYAFARIFNLILHYELENYDFLEYIIKSTNRYLSKNTRTLETEAVVIKFLRKMIKANSQQDQIPLLQNMKSVIEDLYKDENERVMEEYFNWKAWINSKIHRSTLSQAIKNIKA